MAYNAKKTEHAGPNKGSSANSTFLNLPVPVHCKTASGSFPNREIDCRGFPPDDTYSL